MANGFNVAVAGATGAVGVEMIKTLEKRNFPVKNLKLLASARSAGKTATFKGETIKIEEMTEESFKGVDIALFSAGGDISKQFRPAVVRAGAVMIDNSSAFRMDDDVPLVVPEVNPEDIKQHKGVIANPNCTTAIMLVVITLAAFAFARLNFRGKHLAFTLFLALMMIPSELVIITNFVTITDAGLRNTFWGLILPSVTSVFYIYLLKENFAQIPNELYYAAKVDGTSDFKYLWKVMLPICRPTVVTIVILKVIECWNSYVWPRLITDDENYFLVSNGIQAIRENGFGRENIPAMMAAVVVISVPLIVLFLLFRNKVMEGVSRGGTKG